MSLKKDTTLLTIPIYVKDMPKPFYISQCGENLHVNILLLHLGVSPKYRRISCLGGWFIDIK